MNRRAFLAALSGSLLAAPLAAGAQEAGKVYRIGYLSVASGPVPPHAAFDNGLRELGYIEGRNIIVERRFTAGNVDQLSKFATELFRLNVDLIVAEATPGAQAARKATTTIPIIFVGVVDPVGAGLLANLARPDGNITGLSMRAAEASGKRLEFLKEVVPKLSRVAILWNPTNASNPLQLREAEAAARTLAVQLQPLEVKAPNDFEGAFRAAVRGRASALMVLDDPLLFLERTRIASLAAKHRLPVIYGFRESAEAGGLIAYGTSLPDHYQRAATYVAKILQGARPADLPVEQPTKFELVINLKTAKALGLTIPQSLLQRADQVIE